MADILQRILARKHEEVATRRKYVPQAELIAHVKGALAAYKAPRHLVLVDTIGRAPNGKVDYKRLKQHAIDTLG